VLFNAPGHVALENGVLRVRDVRGEVGTTATLLVAVPPGARVTRASVNGVDVQPTRRGGVVELPIAFDGAKFGRLQAVTVGESTFTGGTVRGELTIPRRVFDQLAARKRSWPIPWTAEDSLTTWLVPDRLLLYAQFAEPNDRWDVRLRIDGQPVEMRKGYTAVRVVPSTFVGFYADVSRLAPDRPHRFELEIPTVRPGQFRGLFVENVEPEYTSVVRSSR
jgi:hypothetical protein